MKPIGIFTLLFAAGLLQTVSAQKQLDSLWLYRDSIVSAYRYYLDIGLCDTPFTNVDCYSIGNDTGDFCPTDTGDKFNREYINFNYQLAGGYAGFKIFWDCGVLGWDASLYDTMYLVHNGPQTGHKVKLFWARVNSSYAEGVEWVFMGEFKSSTGWKREYIPFPVDFGKKFGLLELRVLVYNDSGAAGSVSDAGNLKIDDIAFISGSGRVTCPLDTTLLLTPVHSNPANFSTVPGRADALLTWGVSNAATLYEVQVTKYLNGSGFMPVLDTALTAKEVNLAPYLSDEAALFNWRVRAKNLTDSSEWSECWSFSVDPASSLRWSSGHGMSRMAARQKTGSAIVTVELPLHCSSGRMTMLSISGKKIAERTIAGSGLQTVTFSNLPPGIHFLRLSAGGKTVAVKMVKF